VSRADLQRGDLVFWATDTSSPATIHHVAIYLGGSQILEAPESGSVVRVTSMRWGGYIGAVRPSA
jgi:cell wall-associated NlpC family hydrolase